MKIKSGILGCALAAGLMTLAADKIEAGVVINNTLYTPLKLKVIVGYYTDKGELKKATFTSKEALKKLGFKNMQLAINTGQVENNDIVVISKGAIQADLTAQGIMTADINELLESTKNGKNGQSSYKSSGYVNIFFYSNPQFFVEGGGAVGIAPGTSQLVINNPNLDQTSSENASDYWFEITGLYAYSEKTSGFHNGNQNGNQTEATKFINVGAISGIGFDVDLDSPTPDPSTVKGKFVGKGGGKLLVETSSPE